MYDSFTYSSDSEWDRADAYQQGEFNPQRAWVLTDRDIWHRNPFYNGPEMPHPEDDIFEAYDLFMFHTYNAIWKCPAIKLQPIKQPVYGADEVIPF